MAGRSRGQPGPASADALRYRTLMDNAPLGVLFVDADGRVEHINSRMLRMLGLPPDAPFPADDIFSYPPLADSGIADDIRHCMDHRKTASLERRVKHPAGRVIHLRCHLTPVRYAPEDPGAVQAIVEDLSDVKKIERQVRQAHKLEAIGTLAGGIAHDFNNILWIILGNTELAAAEIPPGHAARYNLEQVESACRRAQELVLQIMRFSRQAERERKPLKLSAIVRESLRLLRASIPSNIEIRQHLSTESDTIMADISKINQLMMHLYANAAHAMAETGGTLEVSIVDVTLDEDEVSRHPNLMPGRYVILSVMDTGPGIDPAIVDSIMDPFFTTKSSQEHTGMGLTIVNSIVNSHDGTITVQSEPGKGAVFHIILPVIDAEPEPVRPPRRTKRPVMGTGHILFVDDEAAVLRMGRQMLSHLGYSVTACEAPRDALAHFRSDPGAFDLVLTDQSMPQMTGLALVEQLKQCRPDIPVILCTGFSDRAIEEKALAIGIAEILLKPLAMDDLAASIETLLRSAAEASRKIPDAAS